MTFIYFILCAMISSTVTRPIKWNSDVAQFDNFLKSTYDSEPDADFDEVLDDVQNLWEMSGKFEGDIILNDYQRGALLEEVSEPGLARNGLKDISKRWPGKTIVYEISDDFTSEQTSAIKDAMSDIERSSCVKFKEKEPSDDDYIEVTALRRGCFSQVGYQGRGKQVVNLTPHPPGLGCMRQGTIVHELLHSLGFFHMQSHNKRDDFVDIKWKNILNGRENNFRKYNSFVTTDFGVPYDYDSVLHYSEFAFSKNGKKTIVPKTDDFVRIGQRSGMSNKDVLKLNRMYKCDSNDYDSTNDIKPANEETADHLEEDSWLNDDYFQRAIFEFQDWWNR